MKKLIIALAVLSFGLASCEEECASCTTTTTINGEVQELMTITKELCGDALDAADGQIVTSEIMIVTTTCD